MQKLVIESTSSIKTQSARLSLLQPKSHRKTTGSLWRPFFRLKALTHGLAYRPSSETIQGGMQQGASAAIHFSDVAEIPVGFR